MITRISKQALHYPVGDINDSGYFNWLLPASQSFIDACTAPTDIRQKVCAALIDSTINLIKLKPKKLSNTRVILSLNFPNLFYSQITVFFDDEYFSKFFNRKSPYQTWTSKKFEGSQTQKYHLEVRNSLDIKIVSETIIEEDSVSSSEICFIGELK
ncbi:DUF3916 domain-containing protein [bacterium]|nr:DUF3916 domain-containing protein [bacterium]